MSSRAASDADTGQGAQAVCSRLLVDFAVAMDRNDHERVLALFTESAALEHPGGVLRGRQEISGFLQQRPRQRVTRHLCTNQVIDVVSSSRATGRADVLFFQAFNESGAELPLRAPQPALVEYRAAFLRNDGQWQIQALAIGVIFSG